MKEKEKIKLMVWTEFKCNKCGHKEPTHDDNGEPKEWGNHCGETMEMVLMRKFNI